MKVCDIGLTVYFGKINKITAPTDCVGQHNTEDKQLKFTERNEQ
jgi:hypothetical protein